MKAVCKDIEGLIINPEIMNLDRMPEFFSFMPSGASYRTFVYYAQMINDGRFSLYDYGTDENMIVYGSELAPLVPI